MHVPFLTLSTTLFSAFMYLFISTASFSSDQIPKEGYLLDRALEVIAMKRDDLSIRSDLFSDPFLSTCFKRWMESPLKAPIEAQERARGLLRTAESPVLWLQGLARAVNQNSSSPLPLERYADYELPGHLPGQLIDVIHLILDSINTANTRLSEVRAGVPPETMELFKRYLYPEIHPEVDPEGEIEEAVNTERVRGVIAAAGTVDWRGILEAGLTVLEGLARAQALLVGDDKWYNEVDSFSFRTGLGSVKIGGVGPDVHEGDSILVLDLGGDDLYRGKIASGTDGRGAVIVDLSGDDVYLGGDYTQASGLWGIGVLFDLKGNDLYRAGNWSQGAGLFGVGLLMDCSGADSYLGGSFVQAASSWGWGGLIDLDGEDTYRCNHSGQAYSGVWGVSSLCDINGNDKYISGAGAPDPREPDMNQSLSQGFAFGSRNLAGGGVSILADQSGNDLYQCQYFGQGASYWMGVGILYDEEGKDTYVARRYAQGTGIHFSFGLLLDAGGSDHTTSWGVSQGCGHDYGVGILVNEAGRDTYVSDWLSMGASEANGVGVFVDNSGDDGYEAKASMGVGHLTESRRSGGIGLFIDAEGKDRYSSRGADNSIWALNRWGVGVDEDASGISGLNLLHSEATPAANLEWQRIREKEKARLSGILARSEEMSYPLSIEAMLWVASYWGLEKKIPKEAREILLGLGAEESVPVMVSLLDTPNVGSLIFMRKFFLVHAFHAIPELIEKTEDSDPIIRSRACHQLGLLRDTRATECLVKALKDTSWRVRSNAVRALGEILDQRRLEDLTPIRDIFAEALEKGNPITIKECLGDDERRLGLLSVLSRAVPTGYEMYKKLEKVPPGEKESETLGESAGFVYDHLGEIIPLVERWIRDIKGSDAVASQLMKYLDDPDPEVKRAAAYSLGQMNYAPAIPGLVSLLKAKHLWVRDAASLSLLLFGDNAVCPVASGMKREEAPFNIIALDLLGRINSERSRAIIKKYLEDPDKDIRHAAKRAMSYSGS